MTPPRLAPKLQSLPPILHMLQPDSMPSCSKAARGLFVLLRTDGIFTVNALSPSSSLRQYPYHYAIRAGQNFNIVLAIRFRIDQTISSSRFNYL